jgi:TIR domain
MPKKQLVDKLAATTVFLSYAHEDFERVKPIMKAFESWEWIVFSDRQLLSGADWANKIPKMIDGAYAVVVVWSRHSVESQPVADEASRALAKPPSRTGNARFFPIVIDRGTKPPAAFGIQHAVDLSDWNGDPHDEMFQNVLRGLENEWTFDNNMAAIRDVKLLPAAQIVRKKRAAP